MELRALRPEELDSWIDFTTRNSGRSGAEVARLWQDDPGRFLEGIRVAVDGTRIVSSLRIYRRELYLGGLALPVGGIGSVCTAEGYRGQGLAGQLLEGAVRLMAQWSIPASLLYASQPTLFARHGWCPVPVDLGISEVAVTEGHYHMVTPNPRDAVEARPIKQLYTGWAPYFNGPTVRNNLPYWTGWLAGRWKRALTARRDGRPVGYLAADWTGPAELCVEDFAAQPEEVGALFPALVGALAAERNLPSVRVTYPLALQPGLALVGRQRETRPMYRVTQASQLPPKAAQALDRMLRGETADHLTWPSDFF